MQKTIITTILFLLFLNGFAQKIYKITSSTYATYTNAGGWQDEKTNQNTDGLFLIVENDKIKVTNNANSIFYVYGQPEKKTFKTHNSITWDAYDNKGVSCRVMFKTFVEDISIGFFSVLYSDYSFDYFFKND